MFVWGAISWMAIPWRASSLLAFPNEPEITKSLMGSAPRSGMYLLPNGSSAAAMEQMTKGPVVFASVRTHPMASMDALMSIELLIQIAASFLGCLLLRQTRPMSYGARVLFLSGLALIVGVAGHLENWNWWSFSTGYTAMEMADLLIEWTLAGLAMAKLVR